jgi:putative transposase
VINSQNVKTTKVGGEARGIDGGEKIKGRKRHITVDTQGLLLYVDVHQANIYDGKAAFEVIRETKCKSDRLQKVYADGGYQGELVERVGKEPGIGNGNYIAERQIDGVQTVAQTLGGRAFFAWLEDFR